MNDFISAPMIELTRKIVRRMHVIMAQKRLSTSLSDNQAYPQACTRASIDYRAFNKFRRNPVYNQILEHVTEQEGRAYLELIRDPDIVRQMEEFKLNDRYGGPRTYSYESLGRISPTTLRYVKVLSDLKRHFGTLDQFEICEIGVGYGGQCRIINAYFRPKSYRLVDIRPALGLAQRFLDHFIVGSLLTYRTMNELERAAPDLVLSNYAFSELPRPIQDEYLKKIVLNSARGYLTYNEIVPAEFRSYKAAELIEMIPGARIVEEMPLTHPKNCIIVWGAA